MPVVSISRFKTPGIAAFVIIALLFLFLVVITFILFEEEKRIDEILKDRLVTLNKMIDAGYLFSLLRYYNFAEYPESYLKSKIGLLKGLMKELKLSIPRFGKRIDRIELLLFRYLSFLSMDDEQRTLLDSEVMGVESGVIESLHVLTVDLRNSVAVMIKKTKNTIEGLKIMIITVFSAAFALVLLVFTLSLKGGGSVKKLIKDVLEKFKNAIKRNKIARLAALYKLTKREGEIMEMLLAGLSKIEIQEKLNIAMSTLETHIYHIYKKTGVRNRLKLVEKIKGSAFPGK